MTSGLESRPRPEEDRFWPFLLLSLILFILTAVLLSILIHPEPPPKFVEVDLSDIRGVNEQPPPLGAPDASPAASPAPVATPAPTPEPTPQPTPTPPPQPTPAFINPISSPTPPRKKAAPRPKTKAAPKSAAIASSPSGPTVSAHTQRGSPTGKPGVAGGSRGDFISTPHPEYDETSRQRRYQGRGLVLITYSDGQIISVEVTRSTGVPYLDTRSTSWIKTYWKVRPGASGRALLPIVWRLQ